MVWASYANSKGSKHLTGKDCDTLSRSEGWETKAREDCISSLDSERIAISKSEKEKQYDIKLPDSAVCTGMYCYPVTSIEGAAISTKSVSSGEETV